MKKIPNTLKKHTHYSYHFPKTVLDSKTKKNMKITNDIVFLEYIDGKN